MSSERAYLYVPLAERPLVQLLGARWDCEAQCWYVDQGRQLPVFSRWIPYSAGEAYNVISEAAAIAAIDVPCSRCGRQTEAVCIYCRHGLVAGVPCRGFVCVAVRALDWWASALLGACHPQLRRAPRKAETAAVESDRPADLYVNHCTHCDAAQGQDPVNRCWDDPASWARLEGGGTVRLTPIPGTVRLRGEVSPLRCEAA
jgi:hypothetical protein